MSGKCPKCLLVKPVAAAMCTGCGYDPVAALTWREVETLRADLARVTSERDEARAQIEDVKRVVAPAEGATVAEGARYRIEMYASTCADAIAERDAARLARDESLGIIARTLALQLPPNDQVRAITLDIERLLAMQGRWLNACAISYGYTTIPVLEFLVGRAWDEDAKNVVHALRPSTVRVCPPDEEYDNARDWRVTVRLDASQRILAIEQEVEVRCIGRENGMDVDSYIHQRSRPEPRTDEADHVGRLVQEIARLHGRIEDVGRIVSRVTSERDDALADAVVLRGAARELRSQATDAMEDASKAEAERDAARAEIEAAKKRLRAEWERTDRPAEDRLITIGVLTKERNDARGLVAEMHRKWERERMQTMDLLHEVKAERRSLEQRVAKALEIAPSGQTDGAHHKMWTIDQMVRALTGCPMVTKTAKDVNGTEYTFEAQGESEAYKAFVADARDGDEGPETYDWDTGIAG